MRRFLPGLCLLTLLGLLLPAFAADDSSDATTDSKTKKQYDKLVKSGKPFPAKLLKIDTDKRILTVEVTYTVQKQDAQTLQHFANLQRQLAEAQRHRNPAERATQIARVQLEIEKAQRNMFKGEKQKFDLDAPDAMKIRTMVLPVELDEKGKPKRLTEKEKRELKGPDPSLPGYTADFDSLKSDQMVEIYLAKQPPKTKSKDKDKESDADKTEIVRPRIAMLVILADTQK